MLEEEELGQLGVLEHQTDSATEFGLRAKWRLESHEGLCPTGLFSPSRTWSFATVRSDIYGVQGRRSHQVSESRRTEKAWTRAHHRF